MHTIGITNTLITYRNAMLKWFEHIQQLSELDIGVTIFNDVGIIWSTHFKRDANKLFFRLFWNIASKDSLQKTCVILFETNGVNSKYCCWLGSSWHKQRVPCALFFFFFTLYLWLSQWASVILFEPFWLLFVALVQHFSLQLQQCWIQHPPNIWDCHHLNLFFYQEHLSC